MEAVYNMACPHTLMTDDVSTSGRGGEKNKETTTTMEVSACICNQQPGSLLGNLKGMYIISLLCMFQF